MACGCLAIDPAGHEIVCIATRGPEDHDAPLTMHKTVHYGEKDLPASRSLTEGMDTTFHRDFQSVDGMIIQREKRNTFTDFGEKKLTP